ncbi:hypothetical protein ACFXTH_000792 [Malus domestica]
MDRSNRLRSGNHHCRGILVLIQSLHHPGVPQPHRISSNDLQKPTFRHLGQSRSHAHLRQSDADGGVGREFFWASGVERKGRS